MVKLACVTNTKIYVSDRDKFHIFLLKEGFQNIKIIYSPKCQFIKLHFLFPQDLLLFQKQNIEKKFLFANSELYYYDLDY